MKTTAIALPAVVIAVAVALSSIYVVDEREKALVLQFGQIRQVKEEPGLGLKIPLIQEVVTYDDRILSLDTDTIEVTPSDDRRLVVDAFARYRISDVVQFRQAVGVGGVRAAEDRLSSILNAQIREVLGADQVTSDTILSSDRRELMNRIREQAQRSAQGLGIDVVDVRLKQTNLPSQNLDATFARMRAEREREAADEIARGNEAAQRVRALADRTVIETLSEAEREAQVTRGEADAEANAIFAGAYGADPEFFDFYRSLQAYERALQGSNSQLVMTPDSAFFDYLYDDDLPEGVSPAPARPRTNETSQGEGADAAGAGAIRLDSLQVRQGEDGTVTFSTEEGEIDAQAEADAAAEGQAETLRPRVILPGDEAEAGVEAETATQ
ncbi:membrane protease subunit HflC [Limimaricola variabilis]|jgi:membrane protease subunit HflC|uniref:Membrane protease subunit HflC n=1 Tax=Limimaricola variabilis TaxID=1492771 RepID=A0ABR6HNH2_9RHOB|nr:protease modulator HflC [Limimaricola variabilis]MBB3712097.1 membrane protease subunit HflC [Limimaricola variabilis]WPY93077.1 protease modulator HflC [Limimaricola variabilis]